MRQGIANYMKQLTLLTDWNDTVWMTVEQVVVTRGKRLKFKFYTGSEVEVALA